MMKRSSAILSTVLSLVVCAVASALPAHPRLLVTQADWKKLPAKIESEPAIREIVRATLGRADIALKAPPLTHTLIGRRMLSVSRDALEQVLNLSTAWKVSGEKKYLDRCRELLLTVSAFDDWHPAHHLDTAEMQAAVAIGYDWLYDDLTPADRQTIATALLEKGLKTTFQNKSLRNQTNNWNQVCMGGMVLSAIALMDVEPALCTKALDEARTAIKVGMDGSYAADGAYSEGGGYWQYGTDFAILIVEALRSAGLPDAAIVSHPGFLESGRYVVQAYGTSGLLFDYSDSHAGPIGMSTAGIWMARANHSSTQRDFFLPSFLKINSKKPTRFLPLAAFWVPSSAEVTKDKLPLHFQGGGHSPVAFHRTGYGKDDLFLGIKAGMAAVPHGHMDAGSFVLDWAGQRWAEDLGSQDYNSLEQKGIKLFDMKQTSDRWTVFRMNNFSHNALTYNGQLHRVGGSALIVSSKGVPENETLVDLVAPLGLPKNASAKRSFTMNGELKTVTVIDILEGLNPGDKITWHLMTRAKAEKSDGGYTLELGGKQMNLNLSSPQSQSTTASPADPPPAEYDGPTHGMTRVFLNAVAGEDGKIAIKAVFSGQQ